MIGRAWMGNIIGLMNPTVKYKYKDGVLTANLGGTEQDYYKKSTQAYKDALKKKLDKRKRNDSLSILFIL